MLQKIAHVLSLLLSDASERSSPLRVCTRLPNLNFCHHGCPERVDPQIVVTLQICSAYSLFIQWRTLLQLNLVLFCLQNEYEFQRRMVACAKNIPVVVQYAIDAPKGHKASSIRLSLTLLVNAA